MTEQKPRLVMDIVAPPPTPVLPTKKKHDWAHLKQQLRIQLTNRRPLYILETILGIAIIVIAVHWWQTPHKARIGNTSIFPPATVQQIRSFDFYYLKPSFQTDFVLQPQTISYQSGVLVFEMRSPNGKLLAFTEEATPPNYDTSSLRADKQYANEYGQAFITDAYNRTTGALFTVDHTWVLVNAPQPVGSDLMQQILDSLAPNQTH